MTPMELYLLGSPHLEREGRLVEMDTRKALALLAVLALSGQEQQRERLVTLLYPEAEPASARAAFRRTLSTLHGALGEGILAIRREAVGLARDADLWVDALEFKQLILKLGTPDGLEQAASLYQDDFMAGFNLRDSPAFDEWQYQQSEEYRRLLDRALDQLVTFYAGQNDFDRAVQMAQRRIQLEPLMEESHRQLMGLYARSGNRNAAIQQYRECVRTLEEELGVGPLEETTLLYQQILSGKIVATTPIEKYLPPTPPARAPGSRQEPPPLIARDKELALLSQVLEQGQDGITFIAIEGEAGVGKTRLAMEWIRQAGRAGSSVAQARCFQGETGLAFTPILEGFSPLIAQEGAAARLSALSPATLAEALRLFPDLPVQPQEIQPSRLDAGPGAQTRFFEALLQLTGCLLGGDPPGVLFIDDLQWADSGTLDLISFLARRIHTAGCILLATWRNEQNAAVERLAQLTAELQRSGRALRLPLGRMAPDDITRLAVSRGSNLPPAMYERLHRESEGLPFIALEYLNSFDPARPDWPLPGGVRALLHNRLQAPGETARQLLTAAAVIGRSFDFNTLQSVSGRSEWEAVGGLEELIDLGLIREQDNNRYDFSHEKLRTVAYEEISSARRRLLHLRIAETLAGGGHKTHENAAWTGIAAHHYFQAGETARAAELFRQAGDQARRLYANDEALSAFQSALASGHPDPAGLHEACGDLHLLMGNYREAINSYQAAAAFCSPECLSNLMHKLGEIYHRRGEWDTAESHYQAALDAAGQGNHPEWLAHLFADWSLTAYLRNQMDQARRLADKSLEQARAANDPGALAQAFNMLGILAHAAGALDDSGRYFENSLEAAGQLGDLSIRCASLNNLARLLQERGRPLEAIPLAREAFTLCEKIGDRHHQAAIQNNLADLYHQTGQEEQAMIELKQAVALFAEIDEAVWQDYPEIWKLTEW